MRTLPRVFAVATTALVGCGAATPRANAPPSPPSPPPVTRADRTSSPPATAESFEAKIDPIFARFAAKDGASPGCAVGIYRAGEVVFSKGYGYADLEHEEKITDKTPFYSASLSKQFTAAAVLLLVADGKISLDDDIRKYIPELQDFGVKITLDHLLHHTSGLRDYHMLLFLAGLNEEDVITSREVLWLISHQRTLGFAPGSRFSYSSSGYVLLAEMVARVSGASFGTFLKERLLAPLEMSDSFIREDHSLPNRHRAIGYTLGPDKKVHTLMGNIEYAGSSNLVTTTRDLAKWDANFYSPRVGGKALLDSLRAPGTLGDGTVLEYGRGLVVGETNGMQVEWHNGGFMGYRSLLQRYPTERLTLSVLCNTTEADADGLGQKVATALIPKLSASGPKEVSSSVTLDPALNLASLAGTYVDHSTAELRTLEVREGTLRIGYGDPHKAARELVPVGASAFLVKGSHTRYDYEPATPKSAARLVRRLKMEGATTFEKVDAAAKEGDLTEYAGRYGSLEFANDLEIRVEKGHLAAGPVGGATRSGPFILRARDLFLLEAEDIGVRFERDARGKVVRLVASTDRAREVALARR